MTSLLSGGKNQWAIQVSALSGDYSWNYNNRQQERAKKLICTVTILTINYRCSHNYVTSATGYGVGSCLMVFTMNWGIHQGTVFGLYPPILSSKKIIQAYKWRQ